VTKDEVQTEGYSLYTIKTSKYNLYLHKIGGHSVEAKDHSYKLQWKSKPDQYAHRKRVNLQNKIDKAKFLLSYGYLICQALDHKYDMCNRQATCNTKSKNLRNSPLGSKQTKKANYLCF